MVAGNCNREKENNKNGYIIYSMVAGNSDIEKEKEEKI